MRLAYDLITANTKEYEVYNAYETVALNNSAKEYLKMHRTICRYMAKKWTSYDENEMLLDEDNLIKLYTSKHFALRIVKLFNGDVKLAALLAKEMS